MVQIDENLTLTSEGTVVCAHCGTVLGKSASDPFTNALKREQPSTAAGPGVHADPRHFTDREIVLRQLMCPGCGTALATEIVPRDEPSFRFSRIAQAS